MSSSEISFPEPINILASSSTTSTKTEEMKYLISPLLWTLHKIFGLTHPNNCSVTGGFRKWNTQCGILKVQGYVCGAPCVFVNAVITIGISLCSCVIVSVSHSVCVVIVLLCTLFTWFGAYQSMQLQNLEHCWTSEHLVSRSGFVLSSGAPCVWFGYFSSPNMFTIDLWVLQCIMSVYQGLVGLDTHQHYIGIQSNINQCRKIFNEY